jgi:hypothetical protein
MNWRAFLFAVTIGTLCISCGERLPGTAVRADSGRHPAKTARHESGIRNVTMPAGTILKVRIDNALSTAINSIGDPFTGTLVEPVVMNGKEVLPARTRFKGHVTGSVRSNRLQGRAALGITLDCYELRGSQHPVTTFLDSQTSAAQKKQNIELIGEGAGPGESMGAVAGWGKGAAICAGSDATVGAYKSRKKDVIIAARTVFTFTLETPVPL